VTATDRAQDGRALVTVEAGMHGGRHEAELAQHALQRQRVVGWPFREGEQDAVSASRLQRLEAAREKQSRALERVRRIGLNHVEAAAEGLRQRLAQIVLDALDGDALGLRRIADA